MQLSLLYSLAAFALAQDSFDVKQNLACHEKPCHEPAPCHEKDHKKSCLFGKCPGACICGSGKNKEHYPSDVKPCVEHNVVTKVHVETGCVTDYKVHTSQETVTNVINHCHTETAVFHPEQTFTLTRTESYVVWPAATSVIEGCGKKAPCAHHAKGKAGCCL